MRRLFAFPMLVVLLSVSAVAWTAARQGVKPASATPPPTIDDVLKAVIH